MLLAASQTGGGCKKIINTITLTWGTGGFLYYKELNVQALYPVNSSILIRGLSGNVIRLDEGKISHSGYFLPDETFEIGFGYDGPFAQEIEDDIYIYKLVIA